MRRFATSTTNDEGEPMKFRRIVSVSAGVLAALLALAGCVSSEEIEAGASDDSLVASDCIDAVEPLGSSSGKSSSSSSGSSSGGKVCPPKVDDGKGCAADKDCKSGFCQRGGGAKGTCKACDGTAYWTSLHGVDTVNECVATSGEHKCSSAKHFPCAGTHDNGTWEKCIPPGTVRRVTAVKCLGDAPKVQDKCDATMTTKCGTGGDKVKGCWDKGNELTPCPK